MPYTPVQPRIRIISLGPFPNTTIDIRRERDRAWLSRIMQTRFNRIQYSADDFPPSLIDSTGRLNHYMRRSVAWGLGFGVWGVGSYKKLTSPRPRPNSPYGYRFGKIDNLYTHTPSCFMTSLHRRRVHTSIQ